METQRSTDTDAVSPETQSESPAQTSESPAQTSESPAQTSESPAQTSESTEPVAAEATEGTPEDASESVDTLQAKLTQAIEEARIYKDRWMRLAAEFDNYKKRTSREFSNLVQNANASLIAQLLPALDNMDRALQTPRASEEDHAFARGFEMILQQLHELLQKEGLKPIEAIGEPFDPVQHEAIMTLERADHPPNTVVEEVEKGYMLHGKVLRPAKVAVSRAPETADQGDKD